MCFNFYMVLNSDLASFNLFKVVSGKFLALLWICTILDFWQLLRLNASCSKLTMMITMAQTTAAQHFVVQLL